MWGAKAVGKDDNWKRFTFSHIRQCSVVDRKLRVFMDNSGLKTSAGGALRPMTGA